MKIVAIYDNGGKTLDRYTVLTDWVEPDSELAMLDQFMYLGCSESGSGFSQWGYIDRNNFATLLKKKTQGFRVLTHLGRLVPFEKLNADTQKHIAYRVLLEDGNDQKRN